MVDSSNISDYSLPDNKVEDESKKRLKVAMGASLPLVPSPSTQPGRNDAANADKRFNADQKDMMDKLRKIIKPGE
jgi:hypothetical protein